MPVDLLFGQKADPEAAVVRLLQRSELTKCMKFTRLPPQNSQKSSAKGKQHYDRVVRGSMLQAGNRALIRNLSERGGPGKLCACWEKTVHRVVERTEIGVVYKVQPEPGLTVFYMITPCYQSTTSPLKTPEMNKCQFKAL